MPMPTLRDYSTADTMRPEQKVGKPEEGSDSLDSFIRQAIGREPFLSFPRAGDSPVQWIQLLHALDQQGTAKLSKGPKFNDNIEGKERHLGHCNGVSTYTSESNGVKESIHPIKSSGIAVKGTKSASENMQTLKIPEAVVAFAQAAAKANGEPEKYLPGWPLLSPSKVPMQKCDKCSREFCSPINYRRHIRVHRRSLNIDKDSPKNRDILGAFWDKLSLDESKELVSFKNVTLEEVPGSSIIRALTSFIWKPVFSSLPQAYVKAGSALLDVIQTRPSKFPLSSQELFSILDDASENTFLCAGTADSMQKFVFDGEAGKIGLEMKNLVACTSFLVEQKLVKAWIADKDAEALRCQKLLVEEEEAAQKRQAEILEKRRLKKLRQKEQKSKEQISVEKTDFKAASPETWEDLPSAETTSPVDVSDSHPCTSGEQLDPIQPSLEPNQLLDTDLEADTGSHAGFSDPDVEMASGNTSSANCQNVYHEVQQESSRRQMNAARRQLPKQLKGTSNGFHSGQIPPMSKVGAAPKHGSYRDQRATSTVNGHKVWTRKTKCENEEECSNVKEQREFLNQSDQNGSNELLIGSISVTLGDCSGGCQGNILAASVDQCTLDYQLPRRNNTQEKPIKLDVCHGSTSRSMVKLWRPVGRQEGSMAVQNETREAEMDVNSGEGTDRILSNESCLVQGNIDDNSSESRNGSSKLWEESTDARGLRLFSSRAAAAFLAQRWKEAIAADHVKLVLFPKTGPPGSPEILDDAEVATALPSDCCKVNNLGNAVVGPLEVSPTGPNKAKFRGKPEKVLKLKYIPKQRNGT